MSKSVKTNSIISFKSLIFVKSIYLKKKITDFSLL